MHRRRPPTDVKRFDPAHTHAHPAPLLLSTRPVSPAAVAGIHLSALDSQQGSPVPATTVLGFSAPTVSTDTAHSDGRRPGLPAPGLPSVLRDGQAFNLVSLCSGQAIGQATVRSVLGTTSTRRCAVHNDEVHPADVTPPVRRSPEVSFRDRPDGVVTAVLQ